MRGYLTGIYKNVRSMAGGLKAWKTAGLPTTA
jgi:rhodanese-related sulfurtransferase